MSLVQINRNPDAKLLRSFTLIWLPAFLALVGFLVYRKTGNLVPAGVFWGLGVLMVPVGLAFPGLMRRVWIGWSMVSFPIGFVVSHVAVGVMWYGVMTPVGLILRVAGYDAMSRWFDRGGKTYWESYSPHGRREDYFRQF